MHFSNDLLVLGGPAYFIDHFYLVRWLKLIKWLNLALHMNLFFFSLLVVFIWSSFFSLEIFLVHIDWALQSSFINQNNSSFRFIQDRHIGITYQLFLRLQVFRFFLFNVWDLFLLCFYSSLVSRILRIILSFWGLSVDQKHFIVHNFRGLTEFWVWLFIWIRANFFLV